MQSGLFFDKVDQVEFLPRKSSNSLQNTLKTKRKYSTEPSQRFTTMSGLESYVNNTVSIITADGRNFVGTLKGFDQTVNIILDESHERVYSMTAGIEQVVLGLHIIRGDNVAIIGQLDESVDSKLDFSSIRGMPLEPVVH